MRIHNTDWTFVAPHWWALSYTYLFKYWQWRYAQSTGCACQICAVLQIRVLNVYRYNRLIWLKIWCNKWLKIKRIPVLWRHLHEWTRWVLEHNTNDLFLKTSGFWPRVRARALRAPVFLGSLPSPTGRCAPPRPSQLRCSAQNKK